MRFDCALTMESVVLGAGSSGLPALNELGYVQLTDPPNNGQLAPAQYAELLAAVGPLGGLVDCTIDIGGTGQRMRVTHVGTAASSAGADPQFVMAAFGSPILPGGGQWSFLSLSKGSPAPQAIDPDTGVPLVRHGPATAPPAPTSPYLFADPADLLHHATPGADYGLVHATGTQSLLFPRPKLEIDRRARHYQHPAAGAGRSLRARHRHRPVPAHQRLHPVPKSELRVDDRRRRQFQARARAVPVHHPRAQTRAARERHRALDRVHCGREQQPGPCHAGLAQLGAHPCPGDLLTTSSAQQAMSTPAIQQRDILLDAEDVGVVQAAARDRATQRELDGERWVELDVIADALGRHAEQRLDRLARQHAAVADRVVGGPIIHDHVEGDLIGAGVLAEQRFGERGQGISRLMPRPRSDALGTALSDWRPAELSCS